MDDIIPQTDVAYKQCNACLNFYPATLAYFHKGSKYNKMGLTPQCKKCRGKGTNFGIIATSKEHRDNEKQCSRCNEWLTKDTEHFGRDKGRKDGFNPACKECLVKDRIKRKDRIDRQQKAYQANNKERIRERDRKRHTRDREKRNKSKRQTYHLHAEKRREYARRYRAKHLEMCRSTTRRHYTLHKEHYFAAATHRKARKRSIGGRYTPTQIQEQLKRQHYRCYYAACGFAKFEKRNGKYVYHIEHTFPLSRVTGTDMPANDMGYIVLACPHCNESKGDRFPWEWVEGGRLL